MSHSLFSSLTLRSLTFKNRIFVSPMCQYSSHDGLPGAWHLVHLGSRAIGGAACVIQEASAVSPEGRITSYDAGIWNDAQAAAYRPITQFIKDNGAVPGVQIAHAGRKASTSVPWADRKTPAANSWQVIAPSALPFDEHSPQPAAIDEQDIPKLIGQFVNAAEHSLTAGFDVIEIHAAHGYLLHEFLSPLSNRRTDRYGGSLENRMRLVLEVADAVRKIWPQHLPVFVRISASDWTDGGWDLQQSIALCSKLKDIGIDFIDVSSGGNVPHAKIPVGPGYQVPFAAAIKRDVKIPTGAVGLITEPEQAEQMISSGQADAVLLARELLRDPYWPLHAAHKLGVDIEWPKQYDRAKLPA